MHKEMIVRWIIGLFIGACFSGCSVLKNDEKLLNTVIMESKYTLQDSIFFIPDTDNKSVINFFKKRNTKDVGFKYIYKEGYSDTPADSSYREVESVVYVNIPVKGNSYVKRGKGIDEVTELFLKDSFNYKQEALKKWNLNKDLKKKFLIEKTENSKFIIVSKPVYNLDKNKAILYKYIGVSGYYETTIYFLKKQNRKWTAVYKETTHSF